MDKVPVEMVVLAEKVAMQPVLCTVVEAPEVTAAMVVAAVCWVVQLLTPLALEVPVEMVVPVVSMEVEAPVEQAE